MNSPPGGTASAGEQILEQALGDERIAVAGNLEHVLAGRGAGLGKKREEDVIHCNSGAVAIFAERAGGAGEGGRRVHARFAPNPGP